MNAKVTLELKDFDDLRDALKSLYRIKRGLNNKIEDVKENKSEKRITVQISKSSIESIVKSLVLLNDDRFEWVKDMYEDSEIEIEILGDTNE